MPVSLTILIPDPPAPPEGYAVTGYRTEPLDGRGGGHFRSLESAVGDWLDRGRERFELVAVADEPGGTEATEMSTSWDPQAGAWDEWIG